MIILMIHASNEIWKEINEDAVRKNYSYTYYKVIENIFKVLM